MPRRDRALTRRVLLQGAGALAGAAAAFPSTPAKASRPDLILLCPLSYPLSPQAEGFTFSNFHGDYPFWAPSWTEVLSGRPLGRAVMPERHSLATAFAASGYEPVLVAGDAAANSCAGLGFASACCWRPIPSRVRSALAAGGAGRGRVRRCRICVGGFDPSVAAAIGPDCWPPTAHPVDDPLARRSGRL